MTAPRDPAAPSTAEPAPDAAPAPADAPHTSTPPASATILRTPAELRDRRYVTAALMLIMVLSSMEMTITSTAMPTIISDLKGFEHYSWVASIYLLACTVTMPLYGRLADVLGRKRVLLAAIVLFCLSSTLAGSAHTMIELIVYRGLQGLAAGGIMPVVLTILADIFTLEERAKIQALFSAVWGAAGLAGPAIGATLVHTLGWRSIFFINLPVGLLGLAMLLWKYRERERPHAASLDLPGAALLAGGCMALLLFASGLGTPGWAQDNAVALGIISLVLLAYFTFHEGRTANPILPPSLLFQRAIGPAMAGNFLLGAAHLCVDTYVPLYVQGGRGGGPGEAAGVVTPIVLTWAISGVLGASLVVRWGFRKTAMLGAGFLILGFGGMLLCAVYDAPHIGFVVVLAVAGMGMGPASLAYLLGAQEAVPWQQRGSVTGGVTFCRTMGGAMGVGFLGALFNLLMRPELARLRAEGIPADSALNPALHHTLSPDTLSELQHAIASSLLWVFVAMVVMVVLQGVVSTWMPNERKKAAAQPA
ncbi:MAG: MFS transporter [Planctomycetota bacterium]|nr:MFS transporter [Planctomycetota bacterium]